MKRNNDSSSSDNEDGFVNETDIIIEKIDGQNKLSRKLSRFIAPNTLPEANPIRRYRQS